MNKKLYYIHPNYIKFPPVSHALTQPNGLLAIGGNLEVKTLIQAYKQGIFPWYNCGEPIQWWSPNPRMVLFPSEIIVNRSLKKVIKKQIYNVTMNQDFSQVILSCAQVKRKKQNGTWLNSDLQKAYLRLFKLGYAHSVETWHQNQLIGGLYGIILGKVFFGESMYSKQANASKVALVWLCELLQQKKFAMIDCQNHTEHLENMGARMISRNSYTSLLNTYCPP